MRRYVVALAIAILGIAAGVFSLRVARVHPGYWFAGSSAMSRAAFLVAGCSLIGCGTALWARRRAAHFGPLLAVGGFGWFMLEWNNPGIGSSLAFTAGLVLYVSCPPLVGHAVAAYPAVRAAAIVERAALAGAYVACVGLLGVLPAVLADPRAEGCGQCPRNLVATVERPELAADVARAGVYLGLASAATLAILGLVRLARASGAARRATWHVVGTGTAYQALVAAWFAASVETGLLENGTAERRIWFAEAAALTAVAAGVLWSWVRARRSRAAVAQLVLDLAQSPPPGGLRDVLAENMGDPHLALAYPVGESGQLVDVEGRPVELPAAAHRTSLVREGKPVAVIGHAPGLLGDEQLVEEVTAAARLALENERLQAQVRARLEELRSSRARIVEAGDAERRRLERDLHDGAQQRLVGLALSLRLLRSQLRDGEAAQLEDAEAELQGAIVELRELAHGIFPAVLADEGLAAAVEALSEEGNAPITIDGLPERRYAEPVETAAYTVVAEAARTARGPLLVRGDDSGDELVIEVVSADADGLDVVALEDRVGAIDGRLTVSRGVDDAVTIRAELPCGS